MNKLYITKKIAEKLRAKGYPISEVRIDDRTKPLYYELPKEHPDWMYCKAWYLPRIDEVLAWLREEKVISVEPYASASGWRVTICRAYHQDRCDVGGGTCLKREIMGYNDGGAFEKYEEAAIAGIEYCLDNFI